MRSKVEGNVVKQLSNVHQQNCEKLNGEPYPAAQQIVSLVRSNDVSTRAASRSVFVFVLATTFAGGES